MLKTHVVEEQEEQIRKQVRSLTDEQRQTYYKLAATKIKDRDTYATLNYIIMAGLHHFYLGRIGRGLLNIAVFSAGILMVYLQFIEVGIALILGIVVFELYELFRSQIIVKHYNNIASQKILHDIVADQNPKVD